MEAHAEEIIEIRKNFSCKLVSAQYLDKYDLLRQNIHPNITLTILQNIVKTYTVLLAHKF